MADEGIEIDLENLEKRMDGALSSLKNEFLAFTTEWFKMKKHI